MTEAVKYNKRYPPCGAGPGGVGIRGVAAKCSECRTDIEKSGGAHYVEGSGKILCGACCPYCGESEAAQ